MVFWNPECPSSFLILWALRHEITALISGNTPITFFSIFVRIFRSMLSVLGLVPFQIKNALFVDKVLFFPKNMLLRPVSGGSEQEKTWLMACFFYFYFFHRRSRTYRARTKNCQTFGWGRKSSHKSILNIFVWARVCNTASFAKTYIFKRWEFLSFYGRFDLDLAQIGNPLNQLASFPTGRDQV